MFSRSSNYCSHNNNIITNDTDLIEFQDIKNDFTEDIHNNFDLCVEDELNNNSQGLY